jgi:hypothetical protein
VPPMSTVRETLPQPVEKAIKRVLEKTAANRFATGAEFAAALTVA